MLPSRIDKKTDLMLHHEVMLLSICDKTGALSSCSHLIAAASGILVELVLRKRVTIGIGSGKHIKVSSETTGDKLLDEALALLAKSKHKMVMQNAIGKVMTMPKLSPRVIEELCKRKILRKEKSKVMWVFDKTNYPTIDPKVEREIKSRMAKLLFGQTTAHDRRTTLLVVLAKQLGLLKSNFDASRMERNSDRVARVAKGEKFKARASQSAKLAMNDALAAASVVGAVASGE